MATETTNKIIGTEIQTRIALRYDTYENWTLPKRADESNEAYETRRALAASNQTGPYLKLLKGEIAICEIPTGNSNATTAPTTLFKVGDGEHIFDDLKWGSALAADVYSWAKAASVNVETVRINLGTEADPNYVNKECLVFRNADGTELESARIDLSRFATVEYVEAIEEDLSGRIDEIEDSISSTAEGTIGGKFDALSDRIDLIEQSMSGTTEGSIGGTLSDLSIRLGNLEGEDGLIATTAASTLSDAQAYADGAIDEAIEEVNGVIDDVKDALKTEQERIDTIELFFKNADADNKDTEGGKTLYDALDSLKEIQDFINTEGEAAEELAKSVAKNAEDIGTLQGIVNSAGTGTLDQKVAGIEDRVDGIEDRVDGIDDDLVVLKAATAGYDGNTTIASAIQAVVQAAGTAQDTADGAVDRLDAYDILIGNAESGMVKDLADVVQQASDNADAIDDLDGRLDVVEAKYMSKEEAYIFRCGDASTLIETN